VVIGLLAWLYLEAELTLYAVQINVEERTKIEDIVVGDSDPEGNDDRQKTSG
jgi:hypothetical protein